MTDYMVYNYGVITFPTQGIILIDIDNVFKMANIYFGHLLCDIGLPNNYDFSQKVNKQLYTHAFLSKICHHIRKSPPEYKLKFFSNTHTKDVFRNKLINKIKTVFGFKILNTNFPITEIIEALGRQDAYIISMLEIFFAEETKPKSFKNIKKYLQKNGLKELDDFYFQELGNKLMIMI